MRFTFYPEGRSPIEVDAFIKLTVFTEPMLRPVPRVGERVVLDSEYFEVTDIVHIVQNGAEVRVFVKRTER